MDPSRFHLLCTIALAVLLGVALGKGVAIDDAVAYPAGPVISYGSNPVISVGGTLSPGESVNLLEAPADQDVIITDLHLSSLGGETSFSVDVWTGWLQFTFSRTDGTVLGVVGVARSGRGGNDNGHQTFPSSEAVAMSSGIRIPAGQTLTLGVVGTGRAGESDSPAIGAYLVSGYYAAP